MKPIFLFILSSLFIIQSAFAQNPLVKMWDARFGGTGGERLNSFQQTTDGGYILGGYSLSNISGDKTQNNWDISGLTYDYWIVKIDSLGNKQWDSEFGGTNVDALYSIQQTADGGYILGGTSQSNISGDKTQNDWGLGDFWIVKTDSLGNKQWDKDFGGTGYEELYSVHQTADGGYILGGLSYSYISGDKTQNVWNSIDYWIVKTDSLGNKLWDKDFGGMDYDQFSSLQQTTDGGYILCGVSRSNIGGDKTQNVWGLEDYWIVKIDSLGNKQWDRDFGGTNLDFLYSIHQSADGGYILGGCSASNISGDKTQDPWGPNDLWIIKTDSLGNKQWDKVFGGTDIEDEFGNITRTADGSYLFAGTSYSPISGNKSETNLGPEQTWIIRTDSLGNKRWDKTIFTTAHDEGGLAVQTRDGCYAVANYTNAGVGGHKTQPSWNNTSDYWIVKFCDSTLIPPIVSFVSTQNICPGTCTDFVNLSLYATDYHWYFPGAVPDTSTEVNPTNICYANPGSYDVQLIASNASGSDTILRTNYITVYSHPPPQSLMQSGDTLFAEPGFATYQWFHDGILVTGTTGYYLVLQDSGDYNVIATDTNGCEVEAVIYNVHIGIDEDALAIDKLNFVIFPNPVSDKFTIQKLALSLSKGPSETAVEISIYNVLGEKIDLAVNRDLFWTVDCRPLSPGLYYLELKVGEKIFRTKFIKQ